MTIVDGDGDGDDDDDDDDDDEDDDDDDDDDDAQWNSLPFSKRKTLGDTFIFKTTRNN